MTETSYECKRPHAHGSCVEHESLTHELKGGYRWCVLGRHEIEPGASEVEQLRAALRGMARRVAEARVALHEEQAAHHCTRLERVVELQRLAEEYWERGVFLGQQDGCDMRSVGADLRRRAKQLDTQ